jgi:hypothetical protein
MSAAVGADIEALCSKCGDVWHVVVAKVGDTVAKVQCKQCGGYHRYKSPYAAAASGSRSASSTPRAPRAPKEPVERIARAAVAPDLSKPARPYKPSDKYEVGERVDHPTFGQGVVESIAEPGKVTIFFATGRKVLVHDKGSTPPSGGLARPKPFDHANPPAGGKPVGET